MMTKRAVVLGKGTLAIRVAAWFRRTSGYDLVAVVPVVPEPKWTDSLIAWGDRYGVEVVRSGRYDDLEIDGQVADVDLAVSVGYETIIKEWFIAKCGRILNVHNSPLPRYRGIAPINWALKNGERTHGVTIHEITPGIDDGPIVAQLHYTIYPEFDEVIDVYRRALAYGFILFEQTMPILDRIEPVPQDEALATYFSRSQHALLGERRDFTREISLDRSS